MNNPYEPHQQTAITEHQVPDLDRCKQMQLGLKALICTNLQRNQMLSVAFKHRKTHYKISNEMAKLNQINIYINKNKIYTELLNLIMTHYKYNTRLKKGREMQTYIRETTIALDEIMVDKITYTGRYNYHVVGSTWSI